MRGNLKWPRGNRPLGSVWPIFFQIWVHLRGFRSRPCLWDDSSSPFRLFASWSAMQHNQVCLSFLLSKVSHLLWLQTPIMRAALRLSV